MYKCNVCEEEVSYLDKREETVFEFDGFNYNEGEEYMNGFYCPVCGSFTTDEESVAINLLTGQEVEIE